MKIYTCVKDAEEYLKRGCHLQLFKANDPLHPRDELKVRTLSLNLLMLFGAINDVIVNRLRNELSDAAR